jgi:hypothetical protein
MQPSECSLAEAFRRLEVEAEVAVNRLNEQHPKRPDALEAKVEFAPTAVDRFMVILTPIPKFRVEFTLFVDPPNIAVSEHSEGHEDIGRRLKFEARNPVSRGGECRLHIGEDEHNIAQITELALRDIPERLIHGL